MRGVIYSITLTILLLFITIFVSSMISNYEKVNSIFYDFINAKKSVDDYSAIKYSIRMIAGVEGSHVVNISFPFSLSSETIGRDLFAFTQFINSTYSAQRFSRINVNASDLINVINSGALTYDVVPYGVVVEKQPGSAEKILLSNLSSLRGLRVKINSDAIVVNNYWKNPGYTPGAFNFTFDEIGVDFSYYISNSSNADYIIELEKNGTSVGTVDISFSFQQDLIKVEERNVNFNKVDHLIFSLSMIFSQSSEITTAPAVLLIVSDYLNKTSVSSFI